MAVPQIEQRVAVLEVEVARLKEQLEKAVPSRGDWLNDIYGAFADDPHFEEAMRLGREYRESLRPKATKEVARRKAKNTAKGRQR
jgi:hypothetical protein